MASPKNKIAVPPPIFTVRVMGASSGEPIAGLYIAFKLWKPLGGQTKACVARVVETVHEKEFKEKRYQHLYVQYKQQAAQSVDDPSEQFVLGFTDLEGYLEPVYQGANPWRDRFARLEPDSFKFTVGEEYEALYIRHPSADVARTATLLLNKQFAVRADVNFRETEVWGAAPETSAIGKWLGLGGPALQKFTVEGGSGKNGEQYVIKLPEKPDAYVPLWKGDSTRWWLYAGMPHAKVASVRSQVEDFVGTLGSLKYPATGDQDQPYSVAGVQEMIARAKRSKKDAWEAQLDASLHTFHGALQATTARFQEHLAGGDAFKPIHWNMAHVHTSWASEIGTKLELAPKVVPELENGGVVGPVTYGAARRWISEKITKPPEHLVTIGNGVLMLARGAFAFNAWSELAKTMGCPYGMKSGHSYRQLMAEGGGGAIKNSIHKTGLASDMTGGRLRTSTAAWPIRFEAEFRRLTPKLDDYERAVEQKKEALNGVLAERDEAQAKADEKVAMAELAVTTSPPKARSGAEQKLTAAKKAAQGVEKTYAPRIAKAKKEYDKAAQALADAQRGALNDSARMPNRWRMRFRLYGHSTDAIFFPADGGTPKVNIEAVKNVQRKIAAWAGIDSPTAQSQAASDGGVRGEFAKFLRAKYFAGLPEGPVNDWFVEQFRPAYDFAMSLAAMDPEKLARDYYRDKVVQWRVNFYETDGGTDMATPHYPWDGDADFPTIDGAVDDASLEAKSWLNLSAIGFGCQMHRIAPHKYDTRDQTFIAKEPEKVPRMAFPMAKYLAFEQSKHEAGDVVAAIEDICASQSQAPQHAHTGSGILIVKPTGNGPETETIANVPPSEVDATFFKEWRRAINRWTSQKEKFPGYPPGSKAVFGPLGAQVSLVLNGLDSDRKANLRSVIDTFGVTFKSKKFELTKFGKMIDAGEQKVLLTGAAIADLANFTLEQIEVNLAAKKNPANAEAAAAQGPKPDKKTKQQIPKPEKVNVEDWSVLIQPVFAEGQIEQHGILFQPDHIVMLPPRQNAAHLEWWHFQHNSVETAGNWGALLQECGYSLAVLETPFEGTSVETAEPVHIGLGYSRKSELNSTPWPSHAEIHEQPSNFDPKGSEDLEMPAAVPEVFADEGDA